MGFTLPSTVVSGPAASSWANSVVSAITAEVNPAYAELLQQTTPTSLANNAWTAVAWDLANYDTVGGWTVGSPTKYTVQAGWAGRYHIIAAVGFVAGTSGLRNVGVRINGTGTAAPAIGDATGYTDSNLTTVILPCYKVLSVGDYIEVVAYQVSGGALNTNVGAVFTSFFHVRWVGQT